MENLNSFSTKWYKNYRSNEIYVIMCVGLLSFLESARNVGLDTLSTFANLNENADIQII